MSDHDEIRARLAAATPGPWRELDAQIRHTQIDGYAFPEARAAAQRQTAADIALVMNAPTDLAALLAENEKLRAERVEWAEQWDAVRASLRERDALAATVARVEAAAADHPECDVSGPYCGWKRAITDVRAALAGGDVMT